MHGDVKNTIVTTQVHEMRFGTPTNWTELEKFQAIVLDTWKSEGNDLKKNYFDDTFTIRTTDEEIIISWTLPEKVAPVASDESVTQKSEPRQQWVLRDLIEALLTLDQTALISIEQPADLYDQSSTRVRVWPGEFGSYRGYYEQLALGKGFDPMTVVELLRKAQAADGADFESWKSGPFTMHASTPLWAADRGESGGNAIVGIKRYGSTYVLETEYQE